MAISPAVPAGRYRAMGCAIEGFLAHSPPSLQHLCVEPGGVGTKPQMRPIGPGPSLRKPAPRTGTQVAGTWARMRPAAASDEDFVDQRTAPPTVAEAAA